MFSGISRFAGCVNMVVAVVMLLLLWEEQEKKEKKSTPNYLLSPCYLTANRPFYRRPTQQQDQNFFSHTHTNTSSLLLPFLSSFSPFFFSSSFSLHSFPFLFPPSLPCRSIHNSHHDLLCIRPPRHRHRSPHPPAWCRPRPYGQSYRLPQHCPRLLCHPQVTHLSSYSRSLTLLLTSPNKIIHTYTLTHTTKDI